MVRARAQTQNRAGSGKKIDTVHTAAAAPKPIRYPRTRLRAWVRWR